MRLAAGGKIAAAAVAVAVLPASCDNNVAYDGAVAARSRAQVVPTARELMQTLSRASARSVDVLDWGYQPCGSAAATLSYSVTLRVFAFAAGQDTDFDAFRRQVVGLVSADGWTLRRRPSSRSEALPTVPSAYYWLAKRVGPVRLSGAMGLVGDVNPLVGVTGTITLNGPCFDAGDNAGSLENRHLPDPFSLPSPATSSGHS